MSFISPSDFTGEIDISQNTYSTSDLQSMIDREQENVLRNLLGDDLYLAFIADCVNDVPQTQKYVDLLDGETYIIIDNAYSDDVNDLQNIKYDGLKRMLRYFTYYRFLLQMRSRNTPTGEVYSSGENSERITPERLNWMASNIYNKGIDLYKKAYDYIYEQNDWTDIESISGTTVYTLRTKLLVTGDTVDIGGTDYTIDVVTINTSFTVTSGSPSGSSWQVKFYPNWAYTAKRDLLMLGSF